MEEKRRVMSAFRALSDCQQNQTICCSTPRSELNVDGKNIVERLDIEVLVVV